MEREKKKRNQQISASRDIFVRTIYDLDFGEAKDQKEMLKKMRRQKKYLTLPRNIVGWSMIKRNNCFNMRSRYMDDKSFAFWFMGHVNIGFLFRFEMVITA